MSKAGKTIVVLPPATAAYCHVDKPDTKFAKDPEDAKFSIRVVWDEDADLSKFEEAAEAVAKAEWPKAAFSKIQTPIRLGEDLENESEAEKFEGKKFITSRSKYEPKTIDAEKDPLPDNVRVMSGDLVRISVEVCAAVIQGKKNIYTRLRGVQLLEKRNMGGDYANDFEDDLDGEYEGLGGAGEGADADDDGDF